MREIEQAEKAVADRIKSLQKVRDRLSRARKQVDSGKQLVLAFESLADYLRALPAEPALPDMRELADRATEEARKHREHGEHSFLQEIRALAKSVGMNAGRTGDAMTIGPFQVEVDWKKALASLQFAKTVVERGLPLDPKALLSRIGELSESLLASPPPSSMSILAKDAEEAIRVCVARRGGSLVGELRAELPAVYRELRFIRQGDEESGSKRSQPYSIARFIVEIKTLVQSEFNTSRTRRLRLETAVIENTKNPKKSVFIPNDLKKGHGEGTYFQAIILTGGT